MDKLTYEIEPGLLYGRPGPNKSRWDLDALRRRGLCAVVSLVRIEDPQAVTRVGLTHYVILFKDKLHLPYKTANGFILEIFDAFDRVLDIHLPKGEPVLVHCNSGKDRTGLLLAYYLISRKGLAARRRFQAPVFSHTRYFADPRIAVPERFLGVMGMPLTADGENDGQNLTLAARNAVLNMLELLQERGFTRQQAYIICSVAMDLRISNVVDFPNYVVSALLPEIIFD